jgi:hypothetical protein
MILRKAIKLASGSAFEDLSVDPVAILPRQKEAYLAFVTKHQLAQHKAVSDAVAGYLLAYDQFFKILRIGCFAGLIGTGQLLLFFSVFGRVGPAIQQTSGSTAGGSLQNAPTNHALIPYLWEIGLAAAVAQTAILAHRVREITSQRPDLTISYSRLSRALTAGWAAPWALMGIGTTIHHQTSSQFFHSGYSDPFLIGFLTVFAVDFVAGAAWVYLFGGAEFLTTKPGLMSQRYGSPNEFKRSFAIMLFCGIAGLVSLVLLS